MTSSMEEEKEEDDYDDDNTPISNVMKIRSVGAELLHEDGQTDMKKLIAAFRNLANAPRVDIHIHNIAH
jgi:hypothetical protein